MVHKLLLRYLFIPDTQLSVLHTESVVGTKVEMGQVYAPK